jgi:porin
MKRNTLAALVTLTTAFFVPAQGFDEEYLTGPDATTNLLRKQRPPLQGELTVSGDYNIVAFKAYGNETGEDESASQVLRMYGEWKFEPLGGAMIFKGEYRRAFSDVAPTDFGFNLGYVGMPQSTFSDQGTRLTTLYWKQSLFNGDGLLFAGFLDVTEYVDVYLTASPWTDFSNLVFATGSATIGGLPDATPGVMIGGWLDAHWYASASAVNAYTDQTDPFSGVKDLFDKGELFTSFEIGYVPDKQALFLDNTHLTLWHIDATEANANPQGWGVSFSWTKTATRHLFVFVRGGWSDGGGALLKRSLSIGGAYLTARNDVIGLGVNIGKPNDESFPQATRTQTTAEFYYRFNIGKHLQLTPSMQYIRHPAADTSSDTVWMPGLRVRIYF